MNGPSAEDNDDADDEDEDGDVDEEVYAVEKVLNHRVAKKSSVYYPSLLVILVLIFKGSKGFQFLIKWLGYDKESDNTWEDEENCDGSQQLIDAYWERIGGKPEILQTTPASKRRISTHAPETASKRHRRQTTKEEPSPSYRSADPSSWTPPTDLESWDDSVADIDDVEKTEKGLILVYLLWYTRCFLG